MSMLAKEESNNASFVYSPNALQKAPLLPNHPTNIPSPPTENNTVSALHTHFTASATKVKLNSILKNGHNKNGN